MDIIERYNYIRGFINAGLASRFAIDEAKRELAEIEERLPYELEKLNRELNGKTVPP